MTHIEELNKILTVFDINETARNLSVSPRTVYSWLSGKKKPRAGNVKTIHKLYQKTSLIKPETVTLQEMVRSLIEAGNSIGNIAAITGCCERSVYRWLAGESKYANIRARKEIKRHYIVL